MRSPKKLQTISASAMMVAALGLAACSAGSPGVINPIPPKFPSQHSTQLPPLSPRIPQAFPTRPPAPTPTPIGLWLGRVVGKKTFPVGDTAQGGNGQAVDGISCGSPLQNFHIHSHVSIWYNGQQIAFPIALGIPGAVLTNNGTRTNSGKCFYGLHTHDMSGILHIESSAQTTFTLGEVFDIWGEPLTTSDVAGFTGPVLVYVDANEHTTQATVYSGDPRSIILTNHEQITLEVGSPFIYPLFYTWSY